MFAGLFQLAACSHLIIEGRGGNNQLVSYIDYDYNIIITNIIRIKVQIILY